MNLKEAARAWAHSVAPQHLGRNIREYGFTTVIAGGFQGNFGLSYFQPIEGKVVDANEKFTLVKTGSKSFHVILNELLTREVRVGDKVAVRFYQPRRFDGLAADGSEDPSENGLRTIQITGVATQFPVRWEGRHVRASEALQQHYQEITNPYLRDMITQMEQMPVNGGMRKVINVLIDANASKLEFVDTPDSCSPPPAVRTLVSSKRFVGTVEIYYDRGTDTYAIRLTPMVGTPCAGTESLGELNGDANSHVIDDVHFDELGERLMDAIDDGSWQRARVTVLKPAPKAKAAAAA